MVRFNGATPHRRTRRTEPSNPSNPRTCRTGESPNDQRPRPPTPAGRWIVVVVEAARAHGIEVSGLTALPRCEQADGVDLRADIMLGVRVRGHVVGARVVVDEE